MRLAIIDHVGNPGGGSRMLRALLPAMKALRPDCEITYYANFRSLKREGVMVELKASGIKLRKLRSVFFSNVYLFGSNKLGNLFKLLQRRFLKNVSFLPVFLTGALDREIGGFASEFDVIYFPWPYFIRSLNIKTPTVATFHDFNFRYYFSASGWHVWDLEFLNKEIPRWIEQSHPIVSTHFMHEELLKFYPQITKKVHVIHLAPMSMVNEINFNEAKSIVQKMGIAEDYILYPTNLAVHKNIGALLSAFYHLREKGYKLRLILTGEGTENIQGKACSIGLERNYPQGDVLGLGYVTHDQIDSLIQCARVVVSTSLYEAGNGPGLDAWAKGVPVAMSNIPAFLSISKFTMFKQKLLSLTLQSKSPKKLQKF